MKKSLIFMACLFACTSLLAKGKDAGSKRIEKTYYGKEANSNGDNPCSGEATKVCGVVIVKVDWDGAGGSYIDKTIFDAEGTPIYKEYKQSNKNLDATVSEILSKTPSNATVEIIEDGEYDTE